MAKPGNSNAAAKLVAFHAVPYSIDNAHDLMAGYEWKLWLAEVAVHNM